jgi:YaiO family outer membrane protein
MAALLIGADHIHAQGALFLEASGDYSPVQIGAADLTWHVGRVSAGWLDEGSSGWAAAAERHQRGTLVDWAVVANGFRRAGDWTFSGAAGATSRPEFLYRSSFEGELARRLVGTLVLHGGYRHLDFPTVRVGIVQPAVSLYFPRGELQVRAFMVRNLTLDRHSRAALLRGQVAVHPRVTIAGGAAIGNRIFDVAALSTPDAEGWVGFGFARFTLSPGWRLDLGYGRAHEDPFFSQQTMSIAVRRTFQ